MTITFLIVCCVSALAAAVVGISDNPPGIVLAFVATTTLVLAFVHPWRTANRYLRLLLASVIGFALFAVVHNALEAVAGSPESAGVLHGLLQALGVATFLIAILFCPPAALVGGVGSVVMLVRNRRRRT